MFHSHVGVNCAYNRGTTGPEKSGVLALRHTKDILMSNAAVEGLSGALGASIALLTTYPLQTVRFNPLSV